MMAACLTGTFSLADQDTRTKPLLGPEQSPKTHQQGGFTFVQKGLDIQISQKFYNVSCFN